MKNDIEKQIAAIAEAVDRNDDSAAKAGILSLLGGFLSDVRRIADALEKERK
jgi:hypothetical protein